MAKISVENVCQPGTSYTVDADKYHDMRAAFLKVLPRKPGYTVAQMSQAVLPHLSQTLFPNGAKSGWWLKCVQLDLEAKGIVMRDQSTPLRLFKR